MKGTSIMEGIDFSLKSGYSEIWKLEAGKKCNVQPGKVDNYVSINCCPGCYVYQLNHLYSIQYLSSQPCLEPHLILASNCQPLFLSQL